MVWRRRRIERTRGISVFEITQMECWGSSVKPGVGDLGFMGKGNQHVAEHQII